MISLWFGNFYRPAYDDNAFIRETLCAIREMGFDSVELDSKAWQDFADRFAGGDASQYVAQQEFMMAEIEKAGLAHWFLALYLNGDNLYPNIRFSPPVYGESVQRADGSDGRWYKYWSDKAKDSMVAHVQGLLSHYREHHAQMDIGGQTRLPICSMWDPIVAPSFDAEGQARYKAWLARQYGDIGALNAAYGMQCEAFDALAPEMYWFSERYGEDACYTEEDRLGDAPAFRMWVDNMRWRADELVHYFADMNTRLHALEPSLCLVPDMAQWGYFLNVDASKITGIGFSDLWDTAMRGIDIYRLAPHVDICHFISVPVTPQGDPDAYVAACQHAMLRGMNPGRPFWGGIYWGRFLYNDIYNFLSPAEIMGTIVASGAEGASSYGMCGLDDGGVLHRMDEGFTRSLAIGNRWARRVMAARKGRRQGKIAILFPAAMALLEPLRVAGAEMRRLDLLGLFTACCDFGYAPDVIDPEAITAGALDQYEVLLLCANSCYAAMPDGGMEQSIAAFAHAGGVVVHGVADALASAALGMGSIPVQDRAYTYQGEGGLLLGDAYGSYDGGETLATYRDSGRACIAQTELGQGTVYSFGFLPGYNYAARTAPHVPLSEGNNELYPFTHMRQNALADILRRHVPLEVPLAGKNIETARFENGWVIINHGAHPVTLPEAMQGLRDFQYDLDGKTLIGHSAVWVREDA